jgi:hypothetical protein
VAFFLKKKPPAMKLNRLRKLWNRSNRFCSCYVSTQNGRVVLSSRRCHRAMKQEMGTLAAKIGLEHAAPFSCTRVLSRLTADETGQSHLKLKHETANALKGHGFSRATEICPKTSGFSPWGLSVVFKKSSLWG